MSNGSWLRRLREQCPGWLFWRVVGVAGDWCAVPAPEDATIEFLDDWDLSKIGLIHAATPGELRTLVRERYGWDDFCESCGVLAQVCGHRQPEREKGDQ